MSFNGVRISSNNDSLPRHLYKGERKRLASGNSISVDLPEGWVACLFRGEILSIEPNAHSDNRMHLAVVDCAIDDAIQLMTQGGDLGQVFLQPTSEFTVDGVTVSVCFTVRGDSRFTHAYASMVVTENDKGVMYVALSDFAPMRTMIDVVRQFTGSTQKIEGKSIKLPEGISRATTMLMAV
mgnify:FL=1